MSECFSIVSDLPFKEDVLYFQNIINEYEMALKKSNQNIKDLKNKLIEILEENNSLKEQLNNNINYSFQSLKIIDDSTKMNDDLYNLLNENKLLKEHIKNLENKICLREKEITKKNDLIVSFKQINEEESPKEKVLDYYKKNEKKLIYENEELKKKLKKVKEDLKLELSEKINLLRELTKINTKNNLEKKKEKENKINKKINFDSTNINLNYTNDNIFQIKDAYSILQNKYNISLFIINQWKNIIIKLSKHILKEKYHSLIDDIIKKEEEEKEKEKNEDKFNNILIKISYLYDEQISNLQNDYLKEYNLRKKIQSRYMELRGKIRVMCRVRPLLNNENILINRKNYNKTFSYFNDSIIIKQNKEKLKYEFDYIFTDKSNQNSIYEEISILINDIKHQNNISIISYGQTNSGKSFTIEGPDIKDNNNINNNELNGIIFKSINDIFKISKEYKNKNFKISISIVEIYNDIIYNLLDDKESIIEIFEYKNNKIFFNNLSPVIVKNYKEAFNIFQIGKKMRIKRQNLFNQLSSRSHVIYTIYINFKEEGINKNCKINFIDLAGSEKLSNYTLINDIMKKESQFINISLNSLNNVLNAISLNKNHIPFRECKLTHFLKESLIGNFNILLLLHISPKIEDLNESICTLDFGSRFYKLCKFKKKDDRRRKNSYSKTFKHFRCKSFNRCDNLCNKFNNSFC